MAGDGERPHRQTEDLSSLREEATCHGLPPRLVEGATGIEGTAIDAVRKLSDPEPTQIAGLLEDDPVMSLLEKRALARLLSCAIIRRLPAESGIFASGQPAAELIFVITGMIEIMVPNREAIALEGSRFGDEAALATGRYAMSARTRSEAMLVVIPRRALTAAVAENTAARNAFEIACSIACPASLKRDHQGIGTTSDPLCQGRPRWVGCLPCWHPSQSYCLCRAPRSVTTPHRSWPF